MKAKPDLVPDCDVHGAPMFLDECSPSTLGLEGSHDLIVWRCAHPGCGRYFYGTLGYRYSPPFTRTAAGTPRCKREGAFLVVQEARGLSICPVAGCNTAQPWQASIEPLFVATSGSLSGQAAGAGPVRKIA